MNGHEIQIGLDTIPGSKALAEGGRPRMLALTGPRRNPALPDVPTVAELGFPDFEATLWLGFFLPRETPHDIALRWHAAISRVLQDEGTRVRFIELGFDVEVPTPRQLGRQVAAELTKWDEVIRATNIVFE